MPLPQDWRNLFPLIMCHDLVEPFKRGTSARRLSLCCLIDELSSVISQLRIEVGAAAPGPPQRITLTIVLLLVEEHVCILSLLFYVTEVRPD